MGCISSYLLICVASFLICCIPLSIAGNVETDKRALLEIKAEITHDPLGVMSSWNDTVNICKWQGVYCGRLHQRVTKLDLGGSELRGIVSPYIGNLSFMSELNLSYNSFRGTLPPEMGLLRRLQNLWLKGNLFGVLPPSFFNISSLKQVDLGYNQLEGSLPSDFGAMLPNLQYFVINNNKFSGSIPASISNCSSLWNLVMAGNNFEGQVPSLQGLTELESLFLFDNHLGIGDPATDFDFVSSMANSTMLTRFVIGNNNFSGTFPRIFCNFSMLSLLTFGENRVTGEIPSCIANLVQLTSLDVRENYLVGAIPQSIGMLQSMFTLYLAGNSLSGNIPSSVGNLTLLSNLILSGNNLTGPIPSALGNCGKLTSLDLSYNNLSGGIPPEVLQLSSLAIYLNLSNNGFTGHLPFEVGKLVNVGVLDISDTLLSGEIPSTIGSCTELEELYLEGNSFQGSIPNTLMDLNGLQILDLSRNNLSGMIPKFTQGQLRKLNLSYNNLEGEVPTSGVFNSTGVLVSGNSKLCGGLPELKLHPCNSNIRLGHRNHMKFVLFGISGLIVLVACVSLYIFFRRKRTKKPTGSTDLESSLANLSYQMLHKATNGFSSENLIGSGGSGVVYKGTLDQGVGTVLAIKIFNLEHHGASKSFVAECNALRNIRHRNLIKVLTACSSVDYQGRDFKALVYEYMVNGSLDDWLHPTKEHIWVENSDNATGNLNLHQRLEIAVDVALALEYLHHQCGSSVIHCDLKPSNVLLDKDMVAHVGDFGLAKFLTPDISSSDYQPSSVGVRGTIGYAPPEYGMGNEVSICGDVYSFGILLLEMFTGKRPTDDMFREGMSLHDFVKESMSEKDIKILDHALLNDIVGEDSNGQIMFEALISVLEIAVSCSAESPRERPDMSDVSAKLFSIRNKLQGLPLQQQ